jgi:2-polyprenyl-6-methoxyphenol hydroxylase-like FAD-dependent oxidoreductase
MIDHDYIVGFDGRCSICRGTPSTRPDHTSPRSRFNTAVLELGLTVDHTTTDGWHRSFSRPDGLHLWRITDFRLGCGIQTAYAQGDRYVNHKPYFKDGDVLLALREAVTRDLPAP